MAILLDEVALSGWALFARLFSVQLTEPRVEQVNSTMFEVRCISRYDLAAVQSCDCSDHRVELADGSPGGFAHCADLRIVARRVPVEWQYTVLEIFFEDEPCNRLLRAA
ncbi:MAG TPA: hypothetical protein VGI93_06455 [Steroidobacteraceae bacterium]|jgi:hypothetical protein